MQKNLWNRNQSAELASTQKPLLSTSSEILQVTQSCVVWSGCHPERPSQAGAVGPDELHEVQ